LHFTVRQNLDIIFNHSKILFYSIRYDANHIKKAAIFPNDGNFPPYLDEELESVIQEKGGKVLDHMQLKKVLIKQNNENDDVEVTKIIWENTKTGEIETTLINSLYLSLGPSMKSLTLNIKPGSMSFSARLQSMFGLKQNLIGQMMWAAASSIVFMVRVDCSKIDNAGKK
jgi:hypothetical protein